MRRQEEAVELASVAYQAVTVGVHRAKERYPAAGDREQVALPKIAS